MPNRLQQLFEDRSRMKHSVYFTAGFPRLEDTLHILKTLEKASVDFVEIGFPFSDPLADGPIIQQSSAIALQNGMSLKMLFKQLAPVRNTINLPLILMGYLNPVLQYGFERFVKECASIGLDGLIIPDLPMDVYLEEYKTLVEDYQLSFIPLITPTTSIERIRYLDAQSNGFLYLVAVNGITGSAISWAEQETYFEKVHSLKLKNPLVIGFGIRSREDVRAAQPFFDGAIVGSAFIKHLSEAPDANGIEEFVQVLYEKPSP